MISNIVRFFTLGNTVIVISFLVIVFAVWLFSNRNTMKWVAGCLCAEIITFAIVKTTQNWTLNYTLTMIGCEISPIILFTIIMYRFQTRGEKKVASQEKEIASLIIELDKLQSIKHEYQLLTATYDEKAKDLEVYKELASDYAEDNDRLNELIKTKERELVALKKPMDNLKANIKMLQEKLTEKQKSINFISADSRHNAELECLRIEKESAEARAQGAEGRVERLEEELDNRDRTINALKMQLANKTGEIDLLGEIEEQIPIPEFKSVHEAVLYARETMSDTLVFLDSAIKSAEKSPYREPNKVYKALKAIHEVSDEWGKAKQAGLKFMRWEDAVAPYGFEFKEFISQTAENVYGNEYRFVYKGSKRLFQQHITVGAKQSDKCFSIHMYRDEDENKLIVGHVGRHLTNTRTS